MVVKNLLRQMKTIVMKICFENNRKTRLVNNKNSKKKKTQNSKLPLGIQNNQLFQANLL